MHGLTDLLLAKGFNRNSFKLYYDKSLMLEFLDSKDAVVFELLGGMETMHKDRHTLTKFYNRRW
jgi:hypothetical protein